MAVSLNRSGYEHAPALIKDGACVHDEMDEWSEHQPSTKDENGFIDEHGIKEYARWHLGVDDGTPEDRKGHYKYPYGDFERAHRCGVIAAEVRAARNKHTDIEVAAAHLHGMIDGTA